MEVEGPDERYYEMGIGSSIVYGWTPGGWERDDSAFKKWHSHVMSLGMRDAWNRERTPHRTLARGGEIAVAGLA